MHSVIASVIIRQLSVCLVERIDVQKFKKIHQKAFKIVFNSNDGYDELLQMSNETTISG